MAATRYQEKSCSDLVWDVFSKDLVTTARRRASYSPRETTGRRILLTSQEFSLLLDSNPFKQDIAENFGITYTLPRTQNCDENVNFRRKSMFDASEVSKSGNGVCTWEDNDKSSVQSSEECDSIVSSDEESRSIFQRLSQFLLRNRQSFDESIQKLDDDDEMMRSSSNKTVDSSSGDTGFSEILYEAPGLLIEGISECTAGSSDNPLKGIHEGNMFSVTNGSEDDEAQRRNSDEQLDLYELLQSDSTSDEQSDMEDCPSCVRSSPESDRENQEVITLTETGSGKTYNQYSFTHDVDFFRKSCNRKAHSEGESQTSKDDSLEIVQLSTRSFDSSMLSHTFAENLLDFTEIDSYTSGHEQKRDVDCDSDDISGLGISGADLLEKPAFVSWTPNNSEDILVDYENTSDVSSDEDQYNQSMDTSLIIFDSISSDIAAKLHGNGSTASVRINHFTNDGESEQPAVDNTVHHLQWSDNSCGTYNECNKSSLSDSNNLPTDSSECSIGTYSTKANNREFKVNNYRMASNSAIFNTVVSEFDENETNENVRRSKDNELTNWSDNYKNIEVNGRDDPPVLAPAFETNDKERENDSNTFSDWSYSPPSQSQGKFTEVIETPDNIRASSDTKLTKEYREINAAQDLTEIEQTENLSGENLHDQSKEIADHILQSEQSCDQISVEETNSLNRDFVRDESVDAGVSVKIVNDLRNPSAKPNRKSLSIDLRRQSLLAQTRRRSFPMIRLKNLGHRLPPIVLQAMNIQQEKTRRLSLPGDVPRTEAIKTYKTSRPRVQFEESGSEMLSSFKPAISSKMSLAYSQDELISNDKFEIKTLLCDFPAISANSEVQLCTLFDSINSQMQNTSDAQIPFTDSKAILDRDHSDEIEFYRTDSTTADKITEAVKTVSSIQETLTPAKTDHRQHLEKTTLSQTALNHDTSSEPEVTKRFIREEANSPTHSRSHFFKVTKKQIQKPLQAVTLFMSSSPRSDTGNDKSVLKASHISPIPQIDISATISSNTDAQTMGLAETNEAKITGFLEESKEIISNININIPTDVVRHEEKIVESFVSLPELSYESNWKVSHQDIASERNTSSHTQQGLGVVKMAETPRNVQATYAMETTLDSEVLTEHYMKTRDSQDHKTASDEQETKWIDQDLSGSECDDIDAVVREYKVSESGEGGTDFWKVELNESTQVTRVEAVINEEHSQKTIDNVVLSLPRSGPRESILSTSEEAETNDRTSQQTSPAMVNDDDSESYSLSLEFEMHKNNHSHLYSNNFSGEDLVNFENQCSIQTPKIIEQFNSTNQIGYYKDRHPGVCDMNLVTDNGNKQLQILDATEPRDEQLNDVMSTNGEICNISRSEASENEMKRQDSGSQSELMKTFADNDNNTEITMKCVTQEMYSLVDLTSLEEAQRKTDVVGREKKAGLQDTTLSAKCEREKTQECTCLLGDETVTRKEETRGTTDPSLKVSESAQVSVSDQFDMMRFPRCTSVNTPETSDGKFDENDDSNKTPSDEYEKSTDSKSEISPVLIAALKETFEDSGIQEISNNVRSVENEDTDSRIGKPTTDVSETRPRGRPMLSLEPSEETDSMTVNVSESWKSFDGDDYSSLCCGGSFKMQFNCAGMIRKSDRKLTAPYDKAHRDGFNQAPESAIYKTRYVDYSKFTCQVGPKENFIINEHELNRNFAGSREELLNEAKQLDKSGCHSTQQCENKQANSVPDIESERSSDETDFLDGEGKQDVNTKISNNGMNSEYEPAKVFACVLDELVQKRHMNDSGKVTSERTDGKPLPRSPHYVNLMYTSDTDIDIERLNLTGLSRIQLDGSRHYEHLRTGELIKDDDITEQLRSEVWSIEGVTAETSTSASSNSFTQESPHVYENIVPTVPPPPIRDYIHPTCALAGAHEDTSIFYCKTPSSRHAEVNLESQGQRRWTSSSNEISSSETRDVASDDRRGSAPVLSELQTSVDVQSLLILPASSSESISVCQGYYERVDDLQDRRSFDSDSSSGMVVDGNFRDSPPREMTDSYIFDEYSYDKDNIEVNSRQPDWQNCNGIRPLHTKNISDGDDSLYQNIRVILAQNMAPRQTVREIDTTKELCYSNHNYVNVVQPMQVRNSQRFSNSSSPVELRKINCASQTSTDSLSGLKAAHSLDISDDLPVFEDNFGSNNDVIYTEVIVRSTQKQSAQDGQPELTEETDQPIDQNSCKKKSVLVTLAQGQTVTAAVEDTKKPGHEDSNGRGLMNVTVSTLSSIGVGVKELSRIFQSPFQCCRSGRRQKPKCSF